MRDSQLKEIHEQLLYTGRSIHQSLRFIFRERIWEGFWRYGWVSRLMVGLAVIIGLQFISVFIDQISGVETSSPSALLNSVGGLFQDVAKKEFQFLFGGGMKYVMIILLEIVIFHACRQTLRVLGGLDADASFNAFARAQFRMIKVAVVSYTIEVLVKVGFRIAFGIFGFLHFMEPTLLFLIQSFLMGFAILDNYNEQFELSIKQSLQFSREFIGVGLGLGFLLQFFFLIPVLGTVLGPFLVSVVGTIIMFEISRPQMRRFRTEIAMAQS